MVAGGVVPRDGGSPVEDTGVREVLCVWYLHIVWLYTAGGATYFMREVTERGKGVLE